jgi:hypothetical protein
MKKQMQCGSQLSATFSTGDRIAALSLTGSWICTNLLKLSKIKEAKLHGINIVRTCKGVYMYSNTTFTYEQQNWYTNLKLLLFLLLQQLEFPEFLLAEVVLIVEGFRLLIPANTYILYSLTLILSKCTITILYPTK